MALWKKLFSDHAEGSAQSARRGRASGPDGSEDADPEDAGRRQCTRCGATIPPQGVIACPQCGCGTFMRV